MYEKPAGIPFAVATATANALSTSASAETLMEMRASSVFKELDEAATTIVEVSHALALATTRVGDRSLSTSMPARASRPGETQSSVTLTNPRARPPHALT